MKIFTFIFARGGSKGIKDKNIVKINNRPLIYYSIEIAKKISGEDVYVSTDSLKIKKISEKYGAKVIFRPKNLSKDNSPEILAWKHAIKYLNRKNIFFDIFLSLPTTSPLRSLKDIWKVIKLLKKCDFVVTGSASKRSPWFNMLKVEKNLNAKILMQQQTKYINRQLAPRTYDLTTVAYASRPSYIMRMKNIFDGKVKLSEIPISRALDIDELFDLKIAKLLMKRWI
jgi:N-acylneuraminate cytidylyltransferase